VDWHGDDITFKCPQLPENVYLQLIKEIMALFQN